MPVENRVNPDFRFELRVFSPCFLKRGPCRHHVQHEMTSQSGPPPPCPAGGGTIVRHRDLQAAAGGGGRLGHDQGSVCPHHLLHAHVGAHRGGLRDPEEAEPAGGAGGDQTLVKGHMGGTERGASYRRQGARAAGGLTALLCSFGHKTLHFTACTSASSSLATLEHYRDYHVAIFYLENGSLFFVFSFCKTFTVKLECMNAFPQQ